jgi:hypothetical protein
VGRACMGKSSHLIRVGTTARRAQATQRRPRVMSAQSEAVVVNRGYSRQQTEWSHSGVPSVALRTRRIFCSLMFPRSDVVTLLVVIGMGVAIIPVFRPLPLARLREFVRVPVVLRKVLPPGAIFVVVPVVIILVLLIVKPELNVGLLRCRSGHNCHWRHKGSGQE